jgi:hypothetical protein
MELVKTLIIKARLGKCFLGRFYLNEIISSSKYALSICLSLYSPCGPWPLLQFLNLYSVGMIPLTGDQPFRRPLPTHKHRINTYNDIHASSEIRTHESNSQTDEDGSCLRLERAPTVIGKYA